MPNTAILQTALNLQVQGVEISSGVSVVNRIVSSLFNNVTRMIFNTEYFTGGPSAPFIISGTFQFVCVAHKGAANSVTVLWNVGAAATQFLLGPGGIALYADPSLANPLTSLQLTTGVNTIPVEVTTGSLDSI